MIQTTTSKSWKTWTALLLCALLLFHISTPAFATAKYADTAADAAKISSIVDELAPVLVKTAAKPGSTGGEWRILGLARSGENVADSYYNGYYKTLAAQVKQKKGVLHQRKYTEYSRTILALTAIGKNPANVNGYNLLTPLGDYKATVQQGLNGAVFALLALDSKDYKMPVNKKAKIKATRKLYVNYILGKELSDGGWALSGKTADADVTAMVLQALAPYRADNKKVQAAVERGVKKLSAMQNDKGGFTMNGVTASESTAQVLVMLTALGIDWNDERFVKKGNSTVDHLLSCYVKGRGFVHIAGGEVNIMATEQGFYALAAAERWYNGKNSLYDMTAEAAPAQKKGA